MLSLTDFSIPAYFMQKLPSMSLRAGPLNGIPYAFDLIRMMPLIHINPTLFLTAQHSYYKHMYMFLCYSRLPTVIDFRFTAEIRAQYQIVRCLIITAEVPLKQRNREQLGSPTPLEYQQRQLIRKIRKKCAQYHEQND